MTTKNTVHWSRLAVAAVGLGSLLVFSGCSSDSLNPLSTIQFSDISSAQNVAELSDNSILLAEGTAVSAKVTAIDSEGNSMGALSLRSRDSSIMAVEPSVAENTFIFIGAGIGTTEIDLVIVGDTQGQISAEVVEQVEIEADEEGEEETP